MWEAIKSFFFSIFKRIFEKLLWPVLVQVVKWAAEILWAIWESFLADLIFDLVMFVLKVINAIEYVFNYLIGTDYNILNDKNDLLTSMLHQQQLNNIAFVFVGLSFFLTFILILRRLLSEAVADGNDKSPLNTLFKKSLKAWARIGTTFLFTLLILNLVRISTVAVSKALKTNQPSICDIIFISGAITGIKSSNEKAVLSAYMDSYDTTHSFSNTGQVSNDFEKTKINYIAILIVAIFSVIMFIKVIIQLLKRFFIIAVLFVTGPFFAAMSLMKDEDQIYDKWKGMYLSNFTTAMLVMVGYSVFCFFSREVVLSSGFNVSSNSFVNSLVIGFLIVCGITGIPDSIKFGYNLITDQGRFLSQSNFSIRDLLSPFKLFNS